ncbi:MAG: arylsulfatase [Opitutaceae bacterium]|nr:arylsulfatase [Opitutaceae bacterium]
MMPPRLLALLVLAAGPLHAAASRPNILLILADDIGYSDIGCFGGEIDTPNLDRLAAGGLRFTQFYNTARCCPTRASLLTGLYPHQAGVGYMTDRAPYSATAMINGWYAGDLRADTATIAEVMRGAGYGTYAVGKWHVTKDIEEGKSQHNWPLQRGFDRYYGVIPGASNYFTPAHLSRDNTRIKYETDPEYPAKDFYLTDAFSDHAVRYVNEHAKTQAGRPFFMYLAYTAAHWPMQARPEDIAKYRGKYDGGYTPIRQARFEKMKKLGLLDPSWPLSPQFGDWAKVQRQDWEARCMEVYAAMIDNMDRGIGRVVEALRANGQLDHTLILYLQDNGACAENIGRNPPATKGPAPMPGPADTWLGYGEAWANVSSTPYRLYKHYVHEGGAGTPLIAHWPRGIKRRGELESQPGHLIDIMTTCADVAGATYPTQRDGTKIQPMEGRSLAPAFAGQPIQREAIFWEHEGNRALRIGDWKLVAKGSAGPWELYNMKRDRTEMNDLAVAESARVKAMVGTWERWAERTHAVPWPWKPPYGVAAGAAPTR